MKALAVFSGGLDSLLASAIVRAQDIDVLALFFETPFFSSEKAIKSAKTIDLPIKVVDITGRHLDMVKNPRHGYGSNMNPCIDCHALMIRVASEILASEGAKFLITGEVLGQRPMSQNKQSLDLVAKESGADGLILRPLSAKLLPLTIPEEKGWVKRDLLMDFSGRSRKPQMALARELNITNFPSPGGGCLLTEKVFSRRLKDLFSSKNTLERGEVELLKIGRHFRLNPHLKLVVGRNRKENEKIASLSGRTDTLLRPATVPGPTVLISEEPQGTSLEMAAEITAAYSDAPLNDSCRVEVRGRKHEAVYEVSVRDKGEFRKYMI